MSKRSPLMSPASPMRGPRREIALANQKSEVSNKGGVMLWDNSDGKENAPESNITKSGHKGKGGLGGFEDRKSKMKAKVKKRNVKIIRERGTKSSVLSPAGGIGVESSASFAGVGMTREKTENIKPSKSFKETLGTLKGAFSFKKGGEKKEKKSKESVAGNKGSSPVGAHAGISCKALRVPSNLSSNDIIDDISGGDVAIGSIAANEVDLEKEIREIMNATVEEVACTGAAEGGDGGGENEDAMTVDGGENVNETAVGAPTAHLVSVENIESEKEENPESEKEDNVEIRKEEEGSEAAESGSWVKNKVAPLSQTHVCVTKSYSMDESIVTEANEADVSGGLDKSTDYKSLCEDSYKGGFEEELVEDVEDAAGATPTAQAKGESVLALAPSASFATASEAVATTPASVIAETTAVEVKFAESSSPEIILEKATNEAGTDGLPTADAAESTDVAKSKTSGSELDDTNMEPVDSTEEKEDTKITADDGTDGKGSDDEPPIDENSLDEKDTTFELKDGETLNEWVKGHMPNDAETTSENGGNADSSVKIAQPPEDVSSQEGKGSTPSANLGTKKRKESPFQSPIFSPYTADARKLIVDKGSMSVQEKASKFQAAVDAGKAGSAFKSNKTVESPWTKDAQILIKQHAKTTVTKEKERVTTRIEKEKQRVEREVMHSPKRRSAVVLDRNPLEQQGGVFCKKSTKENKSSDNICMVGVTATIERLRNLGSIMNRAAGSDATPLNPINESRSMEDSDASTDIDIGRILEDSTNTSVRSPPSASDETKPKRPASVRTSASPCKSPLRSTGRSSLRTTPLRSHKRAPSGEVEVNHPFDSKKRRSDY